MIFTPFVAKDWRNSPETSTPLSATAMEDLEGRLSAWATAQLHRKIPLVTALPGAPEDGEDIYYLADATAGIVWHLKYRAASASAYKWEYVGGPSLLGALELREVLNASGTGWADMANVGPAVTVPLAGDYSFGFGAGIECGTSAMASAGVTLGASAPGANLGDARVVRHYMVPATSGASEQSSREFRATGIAAATVCKVQYRADATYTAFFEHRFIRATPVRVG